MTTAGDEATPPERAGPGTVSGGNPARWARSTRWALVGLAAYAALLILFRPATPLEWDEVLAQRAVLHYDVAAHSPQPPGFPAFVAAAKVVNVLVRNPLAALQLVVILSALAAVAGTWALARQLGAPAAVAVGAAAVLATSPEFLFSAVVGTSDVPGTAAGVLAALALVVAAKNPSLLPLAGAVCGVATGIRPQDAAVYLPALLWALVCGVRARRWGSLALGVVTGLAVAAAFWVPAILVTGPRRWWWATTAHVHYMATVERTYHLPGAKLADILRYWFLNSVVGWRFAVPLWLLVIAGVAVLVRRGHGRAAALAGSGAALYMAIALFTVNETVSMRYVLPAIPFVAILAAGALAAARPALRLAFGTVLALWCTVAVAWTSPALLERLKPEPVWAALTWVAQHFDRSRTRIVYDGVITPHVQYVLGSRGFNAQNLEKAKLFEGREQPGEETLFVTPLPVPGAELLFQARHSTRRVLELAWGRYGSCAVSRMKTSPEAVFSPDWQLRNDGWQLWGTGRIHLPEGSKPALVRLCAGRETITVKHPGAPAEDLLPKQCIMVPLLPGPAGELTVSGPPHSATLVPPIQLLPLDALQPADRLASAYMVPQVAHVPGVAGAFWRTDLVVINPQKHPLRIAAVFLPTGRDNGEAPFVSETVSPGRILNVPDVLGNPAFTRDGKLGAMLLSAADPAGPCARDECNFLALSRTYNSSAAPGVWRSTEWLPGVAAADALRQGDRAVFGHVSSTAGIRASVGLASWSQEPARARVRVFSADAKLLDSQEVVIPSFGHIRLDLGAGVTDGHVEVELVGGAEAMLVPYVSMVDPTSGLPAHLLPDALPKRSLRAGWAPPMPRPEVGN